MSCKEFSSIISDIARGRLLDANTRHNALAHSERCAACAAYLRQENDLTEGLRAFAETTRATHNAPAHLENNLLSAFRVQSAQVAPIIVRPSFFSLAWVRVAAVATALGLIALPFIPLRQTAEDASPAATSRSIAATAGDWQLSPEYKPEIENAIATDKPEIVRFIRPAMNDLNPTPANAIAPRRIIRRPARGNELASRQEIATEFFPLDDLGTALPTDELQIVRVRLSRSALAAFGLPYDAAQARERVTADVIIGADGLARAVRFVR